jgi:hypothetical protein
MVEEECYYVESVGGGIDVNTPSTSFLNMLSNAPVPMPISAPTHVPFSSILDLDHVHVQVFNILDVNVSQLVIESQIVSWRPHNYLFICWGFIFLSMMVCWWIW